MISIANQCLCFYGCLWSVSSLFILSVHLSFVAPFVHLFAPSLYLFVVVRIVWYIHCFAIDLQVLLQHTCLSSCYQIHCILARKPCYICIWSKIYGHFYGIFMNHLFNQNLMQTHAIIYTNFEVNAIFDTFLLICFHFLSIWKCAQRFYVPKEFHNWSFQVILKFAIYMRKLLH